MDSTRKGKYIESFRNKDGFRVHVFEYRGHKYDVVDPGWKGGYEPMYAQHRAEQDHIDELIEKEERAKKNKTEPAEVGLDMFFNELM